MPYGFYHILHLVCLIALISSVTLQLKGDGQSKWPKVVTGASGFLLLVSGMGLLARIGNDMAPWVITKLVVWVLIAVSVPVTVKRFPGKKGLLFNIVMGLLLLAAYAVSTKFR